jgi:crotonobetainyl-CoA:carnitine CoA-transferase CaiB-like acyl-CoA transferase
MLAQRLVNQLWSEAGMGPPPAQPPLAGADPVMASSFAVGAAAQASIAAAAYAACAIGAARGQAPRRATIDMRSALNECSAYFQLDGREPARWDALSGLYRCGDGWLRVHANFAHHRAVALAVLGLPADAPRAAAEAALAQRETLAIEDAITAAGGVAAAVRSFAEWDAHPHAAPLAALPLIDWERLGDAPARRFATLPATARPLAGLRVLDLTRILAGPVAGRTLAAYGAQVMLVNSPHLPNIESIVETSRGKLSCHVDLATPAGRAALEELIRGADVFIQGYRPGALAGLGFGPEQVARLNPAIVCVSLCAYGHAGPWAGRRGFDSLVQTALGYNHAEAAAAGEAKPCALPVQILDYATGFLMAFAAQAALLRQAREGGAWHLRLAPARTALWLRGMGRVENGFAAAPPERADCMATTPSGWGELVALRHAAKIDGVPDGWERPSVRPGTHAPVWPVDGRSSQSRE